MKDFPTSGYAVVALGVIGGPFVVYAFRLFTRAVRTIRERYPDSFAALGRPADLLPGFLRSLGTGSWLAAQLMMLKLLVRLPEAVPDDEGVRADLERVQLIGRLWNLFCLPILVWWVVELWPRMHGRG